jgi:hypothetical protein
VHYPSLPHTLVLSAAPSPEWSEHFASFSWDTISRPAEFYPKVVDDGIAIPTLPPRELQRLFVFIDMAIKGCNEAEAERSRHLPPSAEVVFLEWFDNRDKRAGHAS